MNLPGFLQFTPHERKAVLALLLFTGGGGLIIEAGRKFPRYAAGLRQATGAVAPADSAAGPDSGAPVIAAGARGGGDGDTTAAGPVLAGLTAEAPRRSGSPAAERAAPRRRSAPVDSASFPIDVNRAGAAELTRLPGIGPKIAERIVADRLARGPFGSPGDLARVKGIGPATVARLRPLVVAG